MTTTAAQADGPPLELPLRVAEDVVRVRQETRTRAVRAGFGIVDQTKIVTAASELARNTVVHGGGGLARIEALSRADGRRGVRLTFADEGPGIADIEQALRDGFTTGGGLGLGLGGARRLSNEFEIDSAPGRGTRITITRWR
jgi:serine/threonine-protein kinase RsbT